MINHHIETKIKETHGKLISVQKEASKIVSGQEAVLHSLLRALICNGHVFVEGVPGTGKTLIVKTLGLISGCEVSRVQFTVDLLPTDILGLTIYKNNGFQVVKGPIFSNFVIADEINRSPPKTQSALLEAMQEKQVTIGKETFLLPNPFFVMATANPIEQAGVYSLPEAQLDRFIFKIKINYPTKKEEQAILRQNVELVKFQDFKLKRIISPKEIKEMQELAKEIYVSPAIENYILDIVESTRNKKFDKSRFIEWGASPRASIALFIASRAEALMNGRNFVTPQDVKDVAFEVLRHRIILNFDAESENIDCDEVIKEILEKTPLP